jgi:uncharacterized damage-inducible protein DinB
MPEMKRPLLVVAIVCLLGGAKVQEPAAPPRGFRADVLPGLADAESKLVALAEAIPAGKYSWRPSPGVRSISEVFMHVAGSNYFLLTFVGKQPPAGLSPDLEKITDKKLVVAELKRSFEYLRASVNGIREKDLEKGVKMFGTNTTQRGVYLTIVNHLHEHLGQSIAYARMNGIRPPWSD